VRCSRGGRAAVITLTVTTLLALGDASPAGAAPDDGDGGEGQDRAVPALDAEAQLAAAGVSTTPCEEIATPLAVGPVDDFRYDPQRTRGYARDVCFGRLRRGTAWAFVEVQRRFGGSAGTLYACRERWNAAEEPDCNGTLVNPATNPRFFSTCWSNHAAGRAFDLMSTKARGDAVVNWLLAPDANGNYSANARRLGVQQILWRDRCWNTDDDRGVVTVGRMRKCGIGHFDHVHVDLTFRGARGRTSYWGGTPVISPKANGLLWWDRDTGRRASQSWFNYRSTPRSTGYWKRRWDVVVSGDFDSDRVGDDLLRWDRDTGDWFAMTSPPALGRRTSSGRWGTNWDQIVAGDWDGDRRQDDLLLWDVHTGAWLVTSWSSAGPQSRRSGSWPAGFDTIRVGDFDEDNRLDEMFIRDRDSGLFRIVSWSGFVPSVKWEHTWSTAYNQFVVGDFDSDGELNDMLIRRTATGAWRMMSWDAFRPTRRRVGTWLPRYKQIVAADLDAEGRVDDLVLHSRRTGQRLVIEWHYYRWRRQGLRLTARAWDQIISFQRG
jgi:hypothetical protein